MKIKNYSELRENLSSIMDETVNDGVPVLITRPKDKHCILMSYSKFLELNAVARENQLLYVTSAKQLHDLNKDKI